MNEGCDKIKSNNKNAHSEILELQYLEFFLQKAFQLADDKLIAEQEKHKTEQELVKIAAQAAHDIISPVMALGLTLEQIPNMTNEQRDFVKHIETSICNIAKELMQKYSAIKNKDKYKNISKNGQDNLIPTAIANIINTIYEQKKLQLQNTQIKLTKYIEPEAEKFLTLLNPNSLERILSNIINNAKEAIETAKRTTDGHIYIALEKQGKNMAITVSDNGCGISEEILTTLGTEEFISSKIDGHGIGVYSAVQTIKSWNGSYCIDTKPEGGTQFTIYLPII